MTVGGTERRLLSLAERATRMSAVGALDRMLPWKAWLSVTEPGKKSERTAPSLSATTMLELAEINHGADTLIVAVCGPSSSLSSTMVKLKPAFVWPARMVADDGNVTSVRSLEESEPTRFVGSVIGIETFAALGSNPLPSIAVAGIESASGSGWKHGTAALRSLSRNAVGTPCPAERPTRLLRQLSVSQVRRMRPSKNSSA